MKKLAYWLTRWRESKDPHVGLDTLLLRARAEASPEERLEWLHDLAAWLRADLAREGDSAASSAQTVRLRYLVSLLDREPVRKEAFASMLRASLAGRDAFDLLFETGLPRESGILGEFVDRVLARVLPEPPPTDLAALFVRLFPDREAAAKLETIDEAAWLSALSLLDQGGADAFGFHAGISEAAERALMALAAQVAAATQATNLRRRMEGDPGEPVASLHLPYAAERFVLARADADRQALAERREALHREIGAALGAVERGYAHLDQRGVSIGIVYQFERIRAQLQRMGELADLLSEPLQGRPKLRYFLASLVRDVHDQRSVRTLLRQNFSLISRKIVERSAETGEHYIAHDRAEYRDMLRRALGGGALTALTVYMKYFISSLKLPAFFDGFFASVNYAASFVAIQLAGFTLATKQPAMTAPALAGKMRDVDDPARMSALVDQVADLARSQSAAIFGNLMAVAPAAALIYFVLTGVLGLRPVDPSKALQAVDALSIFGPTLFFAAFTGVLLWLSSVIAGWVENWFFYRDLGPALAAHRRLRYVFGPSGARRISNFCEGNIAGFAGNVSLGFLLGSVPVILAFHGLPIEVRHVTLSTGQLTVAVATLGWQSMLHPFFWHAVLGIAGIGILNVGVAFALALNVAIRARGITGTTRWAVYRAILRRLLTRPHTFLFPPRAPADPPRAST